MFSFFKQEKLEPVNCKVNEFVAPAEGELIDVSTVSDPVFAEKMLGESIAFKFSGKKCMVCAPCSGKLSALFPTGHAFGIVMENGTEVMIHIGINTVNAKGDGFTIADKKQGDMVKAGDPIVSVDFDRLQNSYDMSTMLIITGANGHNISFNEPQHVTRGVVVGISR